MAPPAPALALCRRRHRRHRQQHGVGRAPAELAPHAQAAFMELDQPFPGRARCQLIDAFSRECDMTSPAPPGATESAGLARAERGDPMPCIVNLAAGEALRAMHGSLLHGFKQFILVREGAAEWEAIVRMAGVGSWFKAAQVYPDADLVRIVEAAAKRWSRPKNAVLEEFGAALVPTLVNMYGAFIEPSWRTFDLLERVEGVIHRTVRMTDRSASPPQLRPRRISRDEVHIEYDSERRLCALGIGICRGVATHFDERVLVDEPTCRERADRVCLLRIRRDV